jgi:hypothetical protein
VTLPEKIEEVLRLEEQATPGEWESADGTGDGKHRFMYDVVCPTGDGRHRVLLSLNWNFTENLDADRQFIAAARNIIRPLAQGYTAALTALEASDSDRQKLKARVAELEAVCQTIGKQSTEYATKVGYAEGRAMGLEYRVEELEAELAKAKTDR